MELILAPLRIIRDVLLDWWYGWLSLIVISTLWALACLTLVLASPATFALFAVAYELARGQNAGLSDFLKGIRAYFLISWRWALLNLIVGLFFWVGFRFYGGTSADWAAVLFVLLLVLAVFWGMVQLYAIAYIMMYEKPRLRTALRSAAFTLLASPLFSLILTAFVALLIALSLQLVIFIFLGTPTLIALIASRAIRERLRAFKLITDDKPIADDQAL